MVIINSPKSIDHRPNNERNIIDMSATIDYLHKIEAQRWTKYSSALNKKTNGQDKALVGQQNQDKEPVEQSKELISQSPKDRRSSWIMGLVTAIILLAILGVNLKFFLMLKNNTTERSAILTKLNKVEELLENNTRQMSAFSSDMKQVRAESSIINLKLQDIDTKNAQLEKDNDASKTVISNLTKAKDTLLDRINTLEVELGKLTNQKISIEK